MKTLIRTSTLKLGSAHPGKTGASFIEITMVVAIIGMMTSTVGLSIAPQLKEVRVHESASKLGFQLQEARSLAISENRPVILTLDAGAKTMVVWQDRNLDDTRDAGEEQTITLSDHDDVTLTTNWTTGQFLPSGLFMTLPLSRTLTTVSTRVSSAGGDVRTVQVHGSGAVVMD